MFIENLHILLQRLVPQHLLSRCVGKLANCGWPGWKNFFIQWFIKRYNVDMSEAILSEPEHYKNFNDFFTRELKPELRPIVAAVNSVACPVDGYLAQKGMITHGKLLQAKNFKYDSTALLGGQTQLAEKFLDGQFITLYLAPHNYHRVHMPLTGELQQMIYVPGKLFSVNFNTANHIPNLFARNERVITLFKTEAGLMAVILIGAMIVASIETAWAGVITPTTDNKLQQWLYAPGQIILKKGEELGRFKLGSTVIVLMQKDSVSWTDLSVLSPVKLGQLLGIINT